jgi:hypothetical protein
MSVNDVLLNIGEVIELGADLDLSDADRAHLAALENGSPTPSVSWKTWSRPCQY